MYQMHERTMVFHEWQSNSWCGEAYSFDITVVPHMSSYYYRMQLGQLELNMQKYAQATGQSNGIWYRLEL